MSLDAYRGLVMLAMASAGLGIPQVAKHFDSGWWPAVASQISHADWVGCKVWDMIQPAFMFMVGVAMPFSYARRQDRGDSLLRMFGHAVVRSFVLVALGVFLASAWSKQTNFVFTNVLAQIGLGYTFVFLLRNRHLAIQMTALVAILAGSWYLFYRYPVPQPGPDFNYAAYGLPKDWPLLTGTAAHWNKNVNYGGAVDLTLLNLFPRENPYTLADNEGGYHTLNFLPSIATMLLGLLAGELLRSTRSARTKLVILVSAGAVLLVAGLAAGWTICPIIKRIWTPSWALASGAGAIWMLAALYAVVDVAGWRRWTFPLVVVGMNSIAMYLMANLMKPWTWSMLKIDTRPILQWTPVKAPSKGCSAPAASIRSTCRSSR